MTSNVETQVQPDANGVGVREGIGPTSDKKINQL
jgi:hypothetical protein